MKAAGATAAEALAELKREVADRGRKLGRALISGALSADDYRRREAALAKALEIVAAAAAVEKGQEPLL